MVSRNGSGLPNTLVRRLFDHQIGAPIKDWSGDGELTIKENGGTLHLSFGPNWKSNLEHFRLDSFRARFDTPVLPPVPVTFRIAGSGKVVLDMAGIAEFKRVAARRPPAPR